MIDSKFEHLADNLAAAAVEFRAYTTAALAAQASHINERVAQMDVAEIYLRQREIIALETQLREESRALQERINAMCPVERDDLIEIKGVECKVAHWSAYVDTTRENPNRAFARFHITCYGKRADGEWTVSPKQSTVMRSEAVPL